jgi:predicted nucleic acid-binding Zn ribbon protein
MSRHNEYTIKDLVDKMLQVYGLDRKLAEQKLISSWESVMGSVIAKHTKDIFINKQQLFVTLDSSALRNELSLAKSKIITMMNEAAGEAVINELILK